MTAALALMKELVRRYSAPGHTLLDCCMGRGVCGLAALATGRRFLGVELQRDVFEVAARRLSEGGVDVD